MSYISAGTCNKSMILSINRYTTEVRINESTAINTKDIKILWRIFAVLRVPY